MSITRLILTINEQEIIVTFDEAKKLYDELSIIFGVQRADTLFPKDIGDPFDPSRYIRD